ncbi:MAG: CRISPR system precrRNA processing endoribonuclease RAMP protein Cas6 [Chloroflexi bacterium]|nr:MAG: CRISPR system precrRNA processing endoribonuclease RAMP protein Cas6 [Chloroflexota bacterium]
MNYITVSFHPQNGRIAGQHITMRGLHGLLFNVLKQVNEETAAWLHKHPSPKPFSMVPYYTNDGHLAGLRYALITDAALDIMLRAWQFATHQRTPLHLGRQSFTINNVECIEGPDFLTLANLTPHHQMQLEFVSPTAFRQGPGHLPLPLPGNVFRWPFNVWQRYAPERLRIHESWLDWCAKNVFVTAHRIETAVITINLRNGRSDDFIGFVGPVTFHAQSKDDEALRIWQALGKLAAFSGVGHKTTMGMGAVTIS